MRTQSFILLACAFIAMSAQLTSAAEPAPAVKSEDSGPPPPAKPSEGKDRAVTCEALGTVLLNLTSCNYFQTRMNIKQASNSASSFENGVKELCTNCGGFVKSVLDLLPGCPSKIVDIIKLVNNDVLQLADAANMCAWSDDKKTLCALSDRQLTVARQASTCDTLKDKATCLADTKCAWRKMQSNEGQQQQAQSKQRTAQHLEATKEVMKCVDYPTAEVVALQCNGCGKRYSETVQRLYEFWKIQRVTKPTGNERAAEAQLINFVKQAGNPPDCKKAPGGGFCGLQTSVSGERDESNVQEPASGTMVTIDPEALCSPTSALAVCTKAAINDRVQEERFKNREQQQASKDDKTYTFTPSNSAQDEAKMISQMCRKKDGKRCGQVVKDIIDVNDAAWTACKLAFGLKTCPAGCGDKLSEKFSALGCCAHAVGVDNLKQVAKACSITLPEKVDECKKVKANKQSKIKLGGLSCAALSDTTLVTAISESLQTDVASSISCSPEDVSEVTLACASTAPAPASATSSRSERASTLQTSSGVVATFTLTADDTATLDSNVANLQTSISTNQLALADTTATVNGAGYEASVDYSNSEVGATGADEESSGARSLAAGWIAIISVFLAALVL